MDEESKYSSKSKRSALGCCLAFAWFFASFSLAFLVKVLLIKRACNHISYLSLYHSSFACCISKKLIKRNGNLSYWNFRKSGLIFEVPASLKHSSWASSKKMTPMNVGRMKKLPAIFDNTLQTVHLRNSRFEMFWKFLPKFSANYSKNNLIEIHLQAKKL